MEEKKTSPAQIAAVKRYNEKNYFKFTFRMKKADADAVKEDARRRGQSINNYIEEAVKEKLNRK